MEAERKTLKGEEVKGRRCGDIAGGTHDLSGLLGGLNPPEGMRMVWQGGWRQGGELGEDAQSSSEKNLSKVLTQGSPRRLQIWEGSQKGMPRTCSWLSHFFPVPQRPPLVTSAFAEIGISSPHSYHMAPPLLQQLYG